MIDLRRDEIAGKNEVNKRLEQEAMLNKANRFAASSHTPVQTNDEPSIVQSKYQNEDQIVTKELRVIFQLIDQNGDNRISSLEIRKLFYVLGFEKDYKTNAQRSIFDKISQGELDFKNFSIALNNCSKRKIQPKENVLRAFKYFEKGIDSKINGEYLSIILQSYKGKWSEGCANSMMRNAGFSKSKKIDYESFVSTLYSVWDCKSASEILSL